jgi:hypothetical protein
MSALRQLLLASACGLAFTSAPARANAPKPAAKKPDPTEALLAALEQKFQVNEDTKDVNEVPLLELLQDISKRYGINFVINEASFNGEGVANIKQEKPKIAAARPSGLTVGVFLEITFLSVNATYLIKNHTIEVVSFSHAAEVTKIVRDDDGGPNPLVSIIIKDEPLNAAVAKINKKFSCEMLVCPEAGSAKTGRVSARLLNVPADRAVELLALQCDLRVVPLHGAYLITSKDHAKEMLGEKLDEKRHLIELQKAPAKKPPGNAPLFGPKFGDILTPQQRKRLSESPLTPFPNMPFNGAIPIIPGRTFGGPPPSPNK